MTRLEAGGLQLKKERHPVEEVIGSALQRLERRLEPYRIMTHLPENLSMIPMDAILIEQVFINLLDNAMAYGPPDGAIDISVMPNNGMIVCEIADRGPGVQPGDEQRVFEKFYRGSPKREGGLGLGLTICRGIVEAHGGRIWAENRPEGGRYFSFTLPMDDNKNVDASPSGQCDGVPAPNMSQMVPHEPLVLLIEDEPKFVGFFAPPYQSKATASLNRPPAKTDWRKRPQEIRT